ncbi:hypothetical protein D3C81_2227560 [compost metagenome]
MHQPEAVQFVQGHSQFLPTGMGPSRVRCIPGKYLLAFLQARPSVTAACQAGV